MSATTGPHLVRPVAGLPVPSERDRLLLRNRHLDVVVLPAKGADIYSIIDRSSGIDVLFKSPWGWQDPATLAPTGDTQRDWLALYPGGWQQLIPNAGEAGCATGSSAATTARPRPPSGRCTRTHATPHA